jgi:hypothetical protein
MRNVRIIGDDIYYKDVLVAKLVNSPMRTIQGEFVDKFDDPDQESYENLLDDYNELKDNLVGDSDIDDIETACEELRKLTKKAETIEDCCHSFRKSYEFMMDSVK